MSQVPSEAHNGENPAEANRIRNEHPGELEAILNDRVLGGIAVTKGTHASYDLTVNFLRHWP
jgi:pyruvate dehydrogenase phosphatase